MRWAKLGNYREWAARQGQFVKANRKINRGFGPLNLFNRAKRIFWLGRGKIYPYFAAIIFQL
jgi:hypothetical protein